MKILYLELSILHVLLFYCWNCTDTVNNRILNNRKTKKLNTERATNFEVKKIHTMYVV